MLPWHWAVWQEWWFLLICVIISHISISSTKLRLSDYKDSLIHFSTPTPTLAPLGANINFVHQFNVKRPPAPYAPGALTGTEDKIPDTRGSAFVACVDRRKTCESSDKPTCCLHQQHHQAQSWKGILRWLQWPCRISLVSLMFYYLDKSFLSS